MYIYKEENNEQGGNIMNNLKSKEKEHMLEHSTPVECVVKMEIDPLGKDFFEFMRSFQWLHGHAKTTKAGGSGHIYFKDAAGMRKHVTQYKFILCGLPRIQKGLKEILNIKDDFYRLEEMVRFEAIVRLVCVQHIKYDDLTKIIIEKQIETTRRLEPPYDEESWGIELKSVFGSVE